MASASHSQRPYEYLDVFLAAIPHDSIPPDLASTSRGVDANSSPYSKFINTALRLVSGGPACPDDSPHLRDAWPQIQASVQHALHALHHPSSSSSSFPSQQPTTKRKHSPSSSPNATQKKPKSEKEGNRVAGGADEDDAPHLTLHAISATAPVRHKVDITLHAHTLRLAHTSTGASVGRCVRAGLTRAFLLPTRARSSGALQWAVLLLAGDKPAPPPSRSAGSKTSKAHGATADAARFGLACSVPDSSSPSAVPRMTVHAPTTASAPPSKAASSREALLTLLTPTISGTSVTLTTVERGAPLAGITAFRGVRETSLWFFDGEGAGILADARPAEFWALEDLARGDAGVRVRTATGRTCSLVLTRLATRENDGKDEEANEGEDEEEGEETEFQMIDGKEREGILEWVRRHRDAFGIPKAQRGVHEPEGAASEGDGKGKDGQGADAGGDSDSDSNFEVSSAASSDGGSPTGSSGSGSDAGSVAASGESAGDVESAHSSQDQDDDDDDDDDEEVVELDPKHHPLLRAGALPKMSRAAMDAAVGLVVGDLVGQGQVRRDAPGPLGGGAGPGHQAAENEHEHDESDDEEEDELDD